MSEPKKSTPLLQVKGLKKYFSTKNQSKNAAHGPVRAVDGISFEISEGETLGLVGESGSGKSTAGRSVLRLIEPTEGEIFYRGENLLRVSSQKLRTLRREMQIIFQDPFAALNPKKRIGSILEEPFAIHNIGGKQKRKESALRLLKKVGLSEDHAGRFPHEFSGGQLQRIGIARAIALKPRFIVADEPVSSLDVSIQAQIINLLSDLKQEMGMAYLFISHDLAVVNHFCDRVAVLYLGKIVELATRERLYSAPSHPYTEALLSSVPGLETGGRIAIQGEVPNAADPPKGCAFHTRCPIKEKECEHRSPQLKEISPGHFVSCLLR